MKRKKINRYSHTGKDQNEKEAYKNFLASDVYLEKTEEEPINTNKTNESSFEEEEDPKQPKIKKKGWWIKLKDFVQNNLIVPFIIAIAMMIINGYVSINKEQGIQGQKIITIEDNVKELKQENKEDKNNLDFLKENFNIFKTEISKDLEYIEKNGSIQIE